MQQVFTKVHDKVVVVLGGASEMVRGFLNGRFQNFGVPGIDFYHSPQSNFHFSFDDIQQWWPQKNGPGSKLVWGKAWAKHGGQYRSTGGSLWSWMARSWAQSEFRAVRVRRTASALNRVRRH